MMEQLEQAIEALIDPRISNDVKVQANQYIEEIKATPTGWQLCLELFVKKPKSSPHARLFALQIIDLVLNTRFNQLISVEQAIWLRDTLWKYVTESYLIEGEEFFYNRTKLATTLATLFRRLYLKDWNSFFDDLLGLLKVEGTNLGTELFLRVLQAIDEEVVNTTLFRGKDETNLNTDLKDKMRERDLNNLVPVWNQIIIGYQSTQPEFSIMGLGIMGAFADWIDIKLVVTEPFLSLLFQILRTPKDALPSLGLRNAACDCLNMIVSKGMKPHEKMQLLQLFRAVEMISELPLDDSEFIEHVAKLTNKLGLEYFMIWKGADQDPELQANAYKYLEALMPLVLNFLSSEHEETIIAVFPTVNELLNLFKCQTKKGQPLMESQNIFLSKLLTVVIAKFKYPDDFEWEEQDEEDEESHFGGMRKSLKSFFDAINLLNKPLFDSLVHSIVTTTFMSAPSDWTTLELALRILYQFSANHNKHIVFVNEAGEANHLSDMMHKMVESDVLKCNHPSLAPAFFENVVRYHQLFELRPELIPTVFTYFLDQRGIYHDSAPVRYRVWYLFQRFIRLLKGHAGKYAEDIIPSLQQVLDIRPELPEGFDPQVPLSHNDISTNAVTSQLNLFESVGMLVATAENISPMRKVDILQMVLVPLVGKIQSGSARAREALPTDPLFYIELHHAVMAVGALAKGLPEPSRKEDAVYPWVKMLAQSTEIILVLLEATGQYQIIRDAARFAFSRLLTSAGTEILPYLIHLVNGLMTACAPVEMVDLFPFLGLLVHKFSNELYPVMDKLLSPLLERSFVFLNEQPTGTDEMVMLVNLRKAYVSFLSSLFGSRMEGVLCSEGNNHNFNHVLASLIHFTKDHDNPLVQKMAFNILLKMVHSWLVITPEQEAQTNVTPQFRAQFLDFALQTIIPTSFEVPMLKTFDLTDGQTVLIFGEITSLHQTMLQATGQTFLEYLDGNFLPSINCPPQLRQEFMTAIQQLDAKNYRKFFQNFITQSQAWIRSP
ncbi:pre-tRNA nuclear export protein, variant 3 [Entomophthora muscae]|uniref:Pre-tRNA nuclear export protein, variant 3 n=1 Tax=Entomophthora muscae TaxID=34485 RepID=A0ACC2TNK8_9FUNG|nr:pre-tRNA nuclear export protein, variant 3 [Entomophthora muscae]